MMQIFKVFMVVKSGILEAERVLGTEQILLTMKELRAHDRNRWIKWMSVR